MAAALWPEMTPPDWLVIVPVPPVRLTPCPPSKLLSIRPELVTVVPGPEAKMPLTTVLALPPVMRRVPVLVTELLEPTR